MTPADRLMHPAFALIPRTRQRILWQIKTHGDAQAEGIAELIDISLSGARQHLTALEADGLLAHAEVRDGPGRPRYLYRLTPAAESFFPRTYEAFTNEILDELAEEDPELLTRLIERRAKKRLDLLLARVAGMSLAQKVHAIAQIMDADGFLADVQEKGDGSYLIVERNCSMLSVARKHGQLCATELELIQTLLPEAHVSRVAYMMSGQHNCAYLIAPERQPAAASS